MLAFILFFFPNSNQAMRFSQFVREFSNLCNCIFHPIISHFPCPTPSPCHRVGSKGNCPFSAPQESAQMLFLRSSPDFTCGFSTLDLSQDLEEGLSCLPSPRASASIPCLKGPFLFQVCLNCCIHSCSRHVGLQLSTTHVHPRDLFTAWLSPSPIARMKSFCLLFHHYKPITSSEGKWSIFL